MRDGRTLGRGPIGEAARVPLGEQLLDAAHALEPEGRVLLLAGEPYSGKTRALTDFAARCGGSAFIVSLHDEPTGMFQFVSALCTVLGPVARGAQLSFDAMQARLATAKSVEHIVTWLCSHVTDPAWVIVDNVELLADDASLRAFLTGIVRECRSLRWLFAGRTLERLPIEAWLPYGIAAVPLVAMPSQSTPLASLLNRLDETELEFLASMAPLRSLEARLIDAIFGDAGTMMARRLHQRYPALFEAGAPLRFHRDVRTSLIGRLRDAAPGALQSAVRRCAAALESFEFYEELVLLHVQMEARDQLEALLSRRGLALVDGVNVETLSRALLSVQADSPGIRSLQAVLASRRGQFDVAENLFYKALEHAEEPLASQIRYSLGCDLLRRNRVEAARLFERLLEGSVPGGPHQSEIRSALAQAYVVEQQYPKALEQIRFALHVLPESASTLAVVKARAAYVYFYAGSDEMIAERFASEALAQALEQRAYTVAVGAASVMYNVACERDRPREALAALEVLADCGIKIGNVSFQAYAVMAMLEYHVEAGDFDAIGRSMETLRSFDVAYESLVASETLVTAEAMQRSWRGEFDGAYELLAPSAARCVGDDFRMLREAELAYYGAGAGWIERAREHIERCHELATRVDPMVHKSVRAHIFLAVASAIVGDAVSARSSFAVIREPLLRYPRLSCVRDAAELLARLWQGQPVTKPLREAFDRMRHRGAGGFALSFASLPLVRGRNRHE